MVGLAGFAGEEVRRGLERARAVEVVGVDDGEVAVDPVLGAQHGVAGAPGLGAAFGHAVARGQAVDGLIGVFQRRAFRDAVAHGGAEIGLHFGLDDADDLSKAGAQRVEDGEVDDDVAGVVHGRDLLASAEAAAHARGHDHQSGLIHEGNTSLTFFSIIARAKEKVNPQIGQKTFAPGGLQYIWSIRRAYSVSSSLLEGISIRNYYYAQVRRQGGESHPARFVPFTQPEIDWLMEQVLVARAAGQSVRACLQKLSGGDHSLMLRYQNKYRAVVKSRPEYVRGLVEKLNEQGVECDAPTVSHRERADLGQACARMEEAARRSGDGELARACDTLARYLQSAAPAPDAALRAAEKLVQPIKEFLARPASERADGMDEFCALLAERIGEMEAARTDLQPSRSENLQ